MCDVAARMVKTVMRMISADMMTRYPCLFSREVSNRCVIGFSDGSGGGTMSFEGMSRDVGNWSQV